LILPLYFVDAPHLSTRDSPSSCGRTVVLYVGGIRFLCPVGGELLPAESFAFAQILVLTLQAQRTASAVDQRAFPYYLCQLSLTHSIPVTGCVAAAGTAATR
jgi:hypothetical protein